MDALLLVLFGLGLVFALVFWARGLVKGNRGDLIACWCLVASPCLLGCPRTAGGSMPYPLLGIALIALGLDTVIAGAFGEAAHSLSRASRYTLSIGLIAVGILLLLIL